MLRRFNTGFEDGKYSVPAGHLDGGETVLEAAMREAREEVGVAVAPEDLRVVGAMHRLFGEERVDFFVSTERWVGRIENCEPHKCDELRWAPLADLPELTIPYIAHSLQCLQRGEWFQMFGWGPRRDRPVGC